VILADTSVWINHFRARDAMLVDLLASAQILTHPFVIGEIAMGSLANRQQIIGLMKALPGITKADDEEILHFVDLLGLYGKGIGLVDAHLLAATLLTPGVRLWALDKRLATIAAGLRVSFQPSN
jgi:predicted nucleic acid-binding protein